MRRLVPLLLVAAACGGSSTATSSSTTPTSSSSSSSTASSTSTPSTSCTMAHEEGDVTFVSDPAHGYGFSLPPPANWTVDCTVDGNRLARGENSQIDAAVTVTIDTSPTENNERSYLRNYLREVRQGLVGNGGEVTQPRVATYENSPIGILEVRNRDDGVVTVHVVAVSVLATADGHVLRFLVVLPTEGRFGHTDGDPVARRAMATAYSFGGL